MAPLQPTRPLHPIEGTMAPWTQEGLPLHIPHPMPVPIALDTEGEYDPLPRLRLRVACTWHPATPLETPQILEVRIQLREDLSAERRAWLAEIASRMTEWIEADTRLLIYALPFADHVVAQRVTRLALLGVQSLQGEPLWAHPSAVQAGLLPFEAPATQQRKTLGAPVRWRTEGIRPLDPLDPATGLPTWHIALSDCLRLQHLSRQEHATRVLHERALMLVQAGHHPDLATAERVANCQVEAALQTILGFEGLTYPRVGSESRLSNSATQI